MNQKVSGISKGAKAALDLSDPTFWRAGAISTTLVMLVVLTFLTINSLHVLDEGAPGGNVPAYDVINQHIGYQYDWARREDVPVIGGPEPLFGQKVTPAQAAQMIDRGKLVIQSRACMDCHTFFGNGAYYGPDLTKAWLDPAWKQIWMPMTGQKTEEGAMVEFLMHPEKYPTWNRRMPNLQLTETEARDTVAYLKWVAAVDTNGWPANFGQTQQHQ
ncbi:MAG: cytochrome c [Candidimonas sp.]|nr:MAG: cytochrome c [Candidimonas sp.]